MSVYLSPGINVKETDYSFYVAQISTSSAAMIGIAEKGPMNAITLVTSWEQFVNTFGSYITAGYLAYAARAFFDNGGKILYVIRVAHYTDITDKATLTAVKSNITLVDRSAVDTLKIEALSEGTWGDNISTDITDGLLDPDNEFNLTVKFNDVTVEVYNNLSMVDADGNYVETLINGVSKYITVEDQDSVTAAPGDRPAGPINANTVDIITAAQATKWDYEDAKNTAVKFQCDTLDASGHFEDVSLVPVTIGSGNTEPKIMEGCRFKLVDNATIYVMGAVTDDGEADDEVAFTGTLATGTYNVEWVSGIIIPSSGTQQDALALATAANYPINEYYSAITNALGQIDTTVFDDINGGAVDETLNSRFAYYSVSFNNRSTFKIFNQTGEVWRPIAQNNAGVWQYNNNATHTSAETWVNATVNSAQAAISQAISAQAANRMTGAEYAAITDTEWNLSGGFTTSQTTLDFGVTLMSDLATATPQVDNVDVNYYAVGTETDLASGDDGTTGLADNDYIGDSSQKLGYYAADELDALNLIMVPGVTTAPVIGAGLTYCENRQDLMLIADAPLGLEPTDVVKFRKGETPYSHSAFNSSYGALYYPWISISDPLSSQQKLIPPSGGVAGCYARNDQKAYVWYAPAGIDRGRIFNALSLEYSTSRSERDVLYPEGINAIASFPDSGINIWGQKTLQSQASALDRVNVRRLMMYVEEAIAESSRFVVFEPNIELTWRSLIRAITPFLQGIKDKGGFYDFRVQCDAETNPPSVIDLNQLICRVFVKPVKTAEFVELNFILTQTGASFTEIYGS